MATKVLILVGSLAAGGAERVAVSLSQCLMENGDDVHIVTMQGPERDFYVINARVARTSLGMANAHKGIAKIFASLQRLVAIRQVVVRHKPDVVIALMTSNSVLAILATLGLRVPVIASERNYPGRKNIPPVWSLLRRITYGFARAHVAQTERTALWLKQHTSARNVSIIPNSVVWPIPSISPLVLPDTEVHSGAKLIVSVGTKPHQKGFDILIDAFADLARQFPDWVLAIPGIEKSEDAGKPEVHQLKQQIEAHGLDDRVLLPGRVGNIGDWYARADLFVLSSRYEGIPNVLLEAMASGTACIAADCETGPSEIITDGSDGILVPAEDAHALASAMASLMRDEQKRARLGRNARAVLDRYGEQHVLQKWKSVIERNRDRK